MTPAQIDTMIGQLSAFKDKICACPDQACVENVGKDLDAWGKDLQAKGVKDPKLSDEQTKRTQTIMEQLGTCAKRTANMGGGE